MEHHRQRLHQRPPRLHSQQWMVHLLGVRPMAGVRRAYDGACSTQLMRSHSRVSVASYLATSAASQPQVLPLCCLVRTA